MAAISRWVEYSVGEEGVAGTGGGTQKGVGVQGYSLATGASDTDVFSIGPTSNRLHVELDGDSAYITLAEGTFLDPRFIARDVSEKLHNLGKNNPSYDQSQCIWENNQFKLYSGSLGSSSSASVVSGTNTAHLTLGWGTKTDVGGSNNNPATGSLNQYDSGTGGLTVSGTYNGFFDEVYTIVMNREYNIGTPTKGGSNSYTGTITHAGVFNYTSSITYTINISTVNGTTMGGGTGNVPKMSWTSTGDVDNSSADVELLYANYYYKVGTKGLIVKFTDSVFGHCPPGTPAWTVVCTYPQYVQGTNTQASAGTAMYTWSSTRGDRADTAITSSESTFTRLGSSGLYIKFTGSGSMFLAGDQFKVICTGPQPMSYNITNLNFGNVTVSTESPVKCVMFEIMSGAVEMGTVKFGLQSHGTFVHHNANSADTYFRFGTLGPGNTTGTAPVNRLEWHSGVVSGDIDNNTPPLYLYATEDNLPVVSDADDCENVGASGFMGMTSDPIFLNIRLGASEVGANSTVNYRIFFDYS